jgi:hypothetical protein
VARSAYTGLSPPGANRASPADTGNQFAAEPSIDDLDAHAEVVMDRHLLPVAAAALLLLAPAPGSAQRPADAPTYYAAVLTPVGALPPLALPAMISAPSLGVGLDLLYGYGRLVEGDRVPMHTVGASPELTLLFGRLSVQATGAYQAPDCGLAMHCDGYFMGGASGALRVAKWDVGDELTPGFATLSLHADAGAGFPRGGRTQAAAAGLSATFVGTRGSLRIIAFGTPQAVWGRLKVDDPTRFNDQLGGGLLLDGPFTKSDLRFMIGGGLAVVSTRTGLGLHLGIQHVAVHGAKPRVGVGVTWRSTR